MIRKANQKDVPFIHKILAENGREGRLLARPLSDIYEYLRDFVVAQDKDGRLVGVCALHFCWESLSEVRSLAVLPEDQGQGWGKKLVESCLSESVARGFDQIFILTYIPDFFNKIGFKKTSKKQLPNKIWADCVKCVNFPDCTETAMLLEL
ncbi:N-acetyltransferase [Dethiosulfatarculus sandiegensis]|uniref:Acetyltransferase n=1 Tax=Dethiosulfatarculus sandiegensis TaxID=1429043 RepID=A0A0D2JX58_9BACT|nr:N-acetyltransferase [Dethiosulfatarculus sandiegensis]KIX14170.1 acetyltransferase [Dethiosulfatarculus sandiegensis]